jgi:DNA-binding transcriptional MerR regulator
MKKKKRVEYFSTGEAARILGISLVTVSRYFDKGILVGEKNPLSKRRSVSRKSVLALMKKHGMKWKK